MGGGQWSREKELELRKRVGAGAQAESWGWETELRRPAPINPFLGLKTGGKLIVLGIESWEA